MNAAPARDDVSQTFAQVAKYYGVQVRLRPPWRGQRRGSVEKSNDYAVQRWWRTVPDDTTPSGRRCRWTPGALGPPICGVRWKNKQKMTVATLAKAELLMPLPERPYPAVLAVERAVSPQALVCFDGNFYSIPRHQRDQGVAVTRRLDEEVIDIVSAAGTPWPDGSARPAAPRSPGPAATHAAPLPARLQARWWRATRHRPHHTAEPDARPSRRRRDNVPRGRHGR